jgi:hypothetical protein
MHPVLASPFPKECTNLDEPSKLIFPRWSLLILKTLLLGRSPVNEKACPAADLGKERK